MAYLGNSTSERSGGGAAATATRPGAPDAGRGPRGASTIGTGHYSAAQRAAALQAALRSEPIGPRVDWQRAALFGTGLAVGLTVGAGLALLLAPQSGAEARALLRRRGRRLGMRGHDAWDDLRDELREAARRGGRAVKRSARGGLWAAEDALEARRHRKRQRRAEMLDAED